MRNVSSGTIARTVVLALAMINQILCIMGISPIPIDDEAIIEIITTGAVIGAALWSWWKNNSFTKEAIAADVQMHRLKDVRYK